MSYSNFSLKRAKDEFQLTIYEEHGIFSHLPEMASSELLTLTLKENVPLALAINTEKARSELIIINILVELRRQFQHQISFFSGIEFNVDQEKNLNGYCDFIISQSPEQLFLETPIIVLVEAKNENIINGLGQCLAEMVAAKIFNEQGQQPMQCIYGAVTSGNVWKFLKLAQDTIYFDLKEYHIENIEKILGILSAMIRQTV